MRSRGLVVAIAVVLAVLAAVGVVVYTNNVKNGNTGGTTSVIVSTQDIPPNTALNPLLDGGAFQSVNVPNDTLVQGAVTDENELRNQTTASQIFANEQIPTSRLATGTGNVLGISDGHVGLGVQIEGPKAVNGYIQNNDHVVVYATFPAGTIVTRRTIKQLLSPAQIQKFTQALQNGSTSTLASPSVFTIQADFTVTLIQSVKVLSITNPPVDTSTGKPTNGTSNLVLDMLPEDAQALVNASNDAVQLWLGLLPPNKDGSPSTGYKQSAAVGIPYAKVTGVGAA
jgi:Flp pilus assembly protein CpaB